MRSRKASEFEIMEKTFLGGQVSNRYEEFKIMARMTPDKALVYVLLDNLPKMMKLKPIEFIKKLIMLIGENEAMLGFDELTRLSMMMGELAEEVDASQKIPIKRKGIESGADNTTEE